jgi:spermidine/putrescine transport system permease protein
MTTRRPLARLLLWGHLLLVFVFIFVPVAMIVIFSFDADRFPAFPWGGFSLVWYEAIFTEPLVIESFLNSLWVGVATAVISTAIGFAAAYADYRFEFRGKLGFLVLIAVPPTIPTIILGIAMLAFLARIGLFGTLNSVILCHVAISVAFAMAVIRLRLGNMDRDLEPAARNLGATDWQTFLRVVVPFTRSSVAAALFLTMAVSFDEFMVAWFVGGINETLPVRLLNLLQGQVSPRINAIGTVVFAVSITLVFLAQLSGGRLTAGTKRERDAR